MRTNGRRTRGAPVVEPAASPPAGHVIHPDAVYTADEVQAIFKLRKSGIRREWRMGRLRVSKRAGRYFILGRWLIAWLEAGEVVAAEPRKNEKRLVT